MPESEEEELLDELVPVAELVAERDQQAVPDERTESGHG